MLHKYSTSKARIKDHTMQNNGKNYFVTIRKHQVKDYVDVQEIMDIISYIKYRLPSAELGNNCFEVDSKYRQLHFHGIFRIKEFFKYKTISTYGGFRIYWKPIYNSKTLIEYLVKNTHNQTAKQEEIISNNFYTHNKAPNRFI